MTYQSQHDGPLTGPINDLVKAIDALFNIEKKLKRSAGPRSITVQRDRLNKVIKRLQEKDKRSRDPLLWTTKQYFCHACKSVNCIHKEPQEEPKLEGPVQSAVRRK